MSEGSFRGFSAPPDREALHAFMRTNVGCGSTPTTGWVNIDNSPSVMLARHPAVVALLRWVGLLNSSQMAFIAFCRQHHLVRASATRLPLPTASADVVYASHLIEHLDRSDADRFLLEVRRVLRGGGVLRLVIPDLQRLVQDYIWSRDADALVDSLLLVAPPARSFREVVTSLLGSPSRHKWMYDESSLCALLTSHGFTEVTVIQAGQTRIHDPGPLDLFERSHQSSYVEAVNTSGDCAAGS